MDEKTAKEIKHWYMIGKGSIQDLARIYHVTVEQVLDLVGEGSVKTVQAQGDMIDAQEAGHGAEMNYGKEFNTPFTVD